MKIHHIAIFVVLAGCANHYRDALVSQDPVTGNTDRVYTASSQTGCTQAECERECFAPGNGPLDFSKTANGEDARCISTCLEKPACQQLRQDATGVESQMKKRLSGDEWDERRDQIDPIVNPRPAQ